MRIADLFVDRKTGDLSAEKLWFHLHSVGLFVAVQRGFDADLIAAYGSVAYGSSMFAKFISYKSWKGSADARRAHEDPVAAGE